MTVRSGKDHSNDDDDDDQSDSGIPKPSWRDERLVSQKLQPETVDWNTFTVRSWSLLDRVV